MTTTSQNTKRKLSLRQLGEELGNVSKAYKIMGYHRDTFYEVQKAFKVGGIAALVEERRGPRNPHPNRVPEAVEKQIRLLERHSPEFRMRHVETSAPGELLNQDRFYWGTLKGVGKIYVQVVIDAFCSLAFAKVYTPKMPITAADLLYDRVLPFYDALGVTVRTILTDNGREFSGRPEHHPYQLLLALQDIEHRTTKVRSPRTNGFVERMNRTLLDEHFRIKGREKWYESVEGIQVDLDVFIEFYNLKRSHQGYRLNGRTPAQALREALGRKKLPPIIPKEDEIAVTEAA